MASPRSAVTTPSFSSELARKALHIAAAPVAVMYARGLPRDRVLAILGAATLLALGVEIARRAWPEVQALFNRFVGKLLKDEEHVGVTGATWLFGACLVVVMLLPRSPAVAVLWCAIVGDPAATIAGRAWQRQVQGIGHRRKTNAGSLACFVVSAAGAWALAHLAPWRALALALAGTAAERIPFPLDDNARVAIGAGIAAWLVT